MLKSLFVSSLLLNLCIISCAQGTDPQPQAVPATLPANPSVLTEQPSSFIDFDGFLALAAEVKEYRKDRLVTLNRFLELAKQPNTIILDTRSDQFYALKHVKGAVHLNFSDFTMENLARVIPNPKTRILIYCNNNFLDDSVMFASKLFIPSENEPTAPDGITQKKPLSLALNIPTFINLYGYGYRNIYELESMISVNDPRIEFEGTAVKPQR